MCTAIFFLSLSRLPLSPVFPFSARSFSVIIRLVRLHFSPRSPRRGVLRLKVTRHSQPSYPMPPLPLFIRRFSHLTHSLLFPRFLSGNDYSPLFVIPPFRTCPPTRLTPSPHPFQCLLPISVPTLLINDRSRRLVINRGEISREERILFCAN